MSGGVARARPEIALVRVDCILTQTELNSRPHLPPKVCALVLPVERVFSANCRPENSNQVSFLVMCEGSFWKGDSDEWSRKCCQERHGMPSCGRDRLVKILAWHQTAFGVIPGVTDFQF